MVEQMGISKPKPAFPSRRRIHKSRMKRSDQEFLPAALEIIETPPAVIPTAMALVICAFMTGGFLWAWISRLEIYAIATGKIEVIDHAKVIQPLANGRVTEIAVTNGTHVKAGEVLFRLDPSIAAADEEAATDALLSSRAEVERRRAAIKFAQTLLGAQNTNIVHPVINWSTTIPKRLRFRENSVLTTDILQLNGQLDILEGKIVEKQAEIEKLTRSLKISSLLIDTLQQRVDLRLSSVQLKVGAKTQLLDAKEVLQRAQQMLVSDQGSLEEAQKGIVTLKSQSKSAITQFIADNGTRLALADLEVDKARVQAMKAHTLLSQTVLKSPVAGIVQQLSVTTIGQVVSTGQHLMVVVPDHAKLDVEALVNNQDIGFIKVGQNVTIKVDAFPFTSFGTVTGKVKKISSNSLSDIDAIRLQADPAAYSNGSSSQTPASGQSLKYVFPILIELNQNNITVNSSELPLLPGMTVSAEINTGKRSVLEYLLSPLAQLESDSMRER